MYAGAFSFLPNFPTKAGTDTSRQWKAHKYQLALTKSLGEVIRDQNVARKCNISKEHCLLAPGPDITHNLSRGSKKTCFTWVWKELWKFEGHCKIYKTTSSCKSSFINTGLCIGVPLAQNALAVVWWKCMVEELWRSLHSLTIYNKGQNPVLRSNILLWLKLQQSFVWSLFNS